MSTIPEAVTATESAPGHSVNAYLRHKLYRLECERDSMQTRVARLEAKRNVLNQQVRQLWEESILLQESSCSLADVIKPLGDRKALVKVHPDGRMIVEVDRKVDMAEVVANARVALRSDSYKLVRVLPSQVDPLVALMKVEKVPDSTYDVIGGLDKQIREFFIVPRPSARGDNPWDKYVLGGCKTKLFSRKEQLAILTLGKSLSFLRDAQDHQYKLPRPLLSEARLAGAFTVDKAEPERVASRVMPFVDVANRHVAQRVLWILNDKYHMADHLSGIRDLVTLGRGDFASVLLADIVTILDRDDSSRLLRNRVSDIVSGALSKSSADRLPLYVKQAVDVAVRGKRTAGGAQASGWDSFNLSYVVPGPIQPVIKPMHLHSYASVFKMIWSVFKMIWRNG
ncbi:gamma-tubulin complex component protein [Kipferlia bialata]|uniref:Gamma-tubulin complex component protein n=1 Tax=Kipferlia bialata TaxID=797122 RepID=A0A9K3CU90_9EUKA|nr:gamma-tubulin complex component protein [Kipferlia bialata]|eukprot:g4578.t1